MLRYFIVQRLSPRVLPPFLWTGYLEFVSDTFCGVCKAACVGGGTAVGLFFFPEGRRSFTQNRRNVDHSCLANMIVFYDYHTPWVYSSGWTFGFLKIIFFLGVKLLKRGAKRGASTKKQCSCTVAWLALLQLHPPFLLAFFTWKWCKIKSAVLVSIECSTPL